MTNATSTIGDHAILIDHEETNENIRQTYEASYGKLISFAISRGCRREDADEIVQQAFFKLLNRQQNPDPDLKPIDDLYPYLVTTVANLIKDFHKKDHSKQHDFIDDDENPVQPSDRGIHALEIQIKLQRTEYFDNVILPHLGGFNPRELKLARLIFIDRLKPHDIATYCEESYNDIATDCTRVKSKMYYRLRNIVLEM